MFKRQVENRLNTLQQILPDTTNGQSSFELEFVSNFQVDIQSIDLHVYLVFSSRLCKQVYEIHLVMFDHHPKRH